MASMMMSMIESLKLTTLTLSSFPPSLCLIIKVSNHAFSL